MDRINKLRKDLELKKLGAVLIENPVDLLYLTGLQLSLGRLLVTQVNATLFVDGRYIAFAKSHSPCEVLPLEGCLLPQEKIGFDSSFISVEAFDDLKNKFPLVEWVPLCQPLKRLRCVKEKNEIEALRKAQQLTREGLAHVVSLLKEGVTEELLSLEFEFFCKKRGASALSFAPIVAFGENSAYPHHRAGKTVLKKDQVVLIDVGAVVDGYAGDMTRVVFFGKKDPQLLKDYELIQEAQKKAIALAAPGVMFGDLNQIARKTIEDAGCSHLFTHGLSHGIGLETHEYPRLKIAGGEEKLVLEEGMSFTVEPGIYRVGLGGVRYEDVVVVTKEGHETL